MDIDFKDIELFEDKNGRKISYDTLLKDIYENSAETKESVREVIEKMADLANSPADAVSMLEGLAKLLDARVKNDDLLVKVANIVGRIIQKKMGNISESPDELISAEEIEQIVASANEMLDK